VRLIAWIGSLSYGIYLWHMPFALAFTTQVARVLPPIAGKPFIIVVAYLAFSVLLGVVSWVLFEKQALALRERLVRA
jgi:peptidoglycan/LPS O-acetylase OafA/YrhL